MNDAMRLAQRADYARINATDYPDTEGVVCEYTTEDAHDGQWCNDEATWVNKDAFASRKDCRNGSAPNDAAACFLCDKHYSILGTEEHFTGAAPSPTATLAEHAFYVWHGHHEGVVTQYTTADEYVERLDNLRHGYKGREQTGTRLALIRPVLNQAEADRIWKTYKSTANFEDYRERDEQFRVLHDTECKCSLYSFDSHTIDFGKDEYSWSAAMKTKPAPSTTTAPRPRGNGRYIVEGPNGTSDIFDTRQEAEDHIQSAIEDDGSDESDDSWSVYELLDRSFSISHSVSVTIDY